MTAPAATPAEARSAAAAPGPSLMTLSLDDPRSVRAWSGTTRNMVNALAGDFSAVYPGGPVASGSLKYMFKLNALSRRLFGKETLPHFSAPVVRDYARSVRAYYDRYKPDVVFAPIGAILLDGVPDGVPVIYASDATVRLLFDYYPDFTNVSRRARAAAERLERRALARAEVALYPTEWAATSAIRDFGADPAKILVAPFGANLEDLPDAAEVAAAVAIRRARGGVRLVLIGVNWRTKGCDIAVDCLRVLRGRGVEAELTIVGCAPPAPVAAPGLTILPFLDKSRPEEAARFRRLLLEADFMIQPTRNECFGVVFCEAAAFGVPALAADTGGVAEIVRDGENGYTLPLAAGGEAYAEIVANLLADRAAWTDMARRGRALHESDYNWDIWGERNRNFIRARLGF